MTTTVDVAKQQLVAATGPHDVSVAKQQLIAVTSPPNVSVAKMMLYMVSRRIAYKFQAQVIG